MMMGMVWLKSNDPGKGFAAEGGWGKKGQVRWVGSDHSVLCRL